MNITISGSRASASSLASRVRPDVGTLRCLLPTSPGDTAAPTTGPVRLRLLALVLSPVVDVGSPSRRRRRGRTGVCGGVPVVLLAFPSSLSWDLVFLMLTLCGVYKESLEELMEPWRETVDCGLDELGIEVERV